MENTEHSPETPQEIITPIPPSSRNHITIMALIGLVLIVAAGALGYYLGKRSVSTTVVLVTPTPIASPSPIVMASPAPQQYENKEFGFSFDLAADERVNACPNKNEFNDSIALWVVKKTGDESPAFPFESECNSGGPNEFVSASRKSQGPPTVVEQIALLESPDSGYKVTRTPIAVSDVTGTRVTGKRDPNKVAPLPDSIDELLFEKDGVLYVIPATYLDRNFAFIKTSGQATYQGRLSSFTINYPSSYQATQADVNDSSQTPNQVIEQMIFKDPTSKVEEFSVRVDKSVTTLPVYPYDQKPTGTYTLDKVAGIYLELPNGYGDGGNWKPRPTTYLIFIHDNREYELTFFGVSDIKNPEIQAILKGFRFSK